MGESQKRKQGVYGPGQNKRRKYVSQRDGGSNRLHNERVQAMRLERGFLEAGDIGIWVTCARGQEGKAAREVTVLFDDHVERVYNLKPPGHDDDDDDQGDIAASIEKELNCIKTERKTPARPFTIIRVNLECVLFVRTRDPIEPVAFCKAVCQNIQKSVGESGRWMSRYLNRLTPVTYTAKATEEGVNQVGRKVLPRWFQLNSEPGTDSTGEGTSAMSGKEIEASDSTGYSFSIRPSFRNHNTIKRDDLIKQIARLINGQKHQVNLSSPDKVILVDLYEAFVCMSVVDGDWEQLRRYNVSELLRQPRAETKKAAEKTTDQATVNQNGAGEKEKATDPIENRKEEGNSKA